MMMRRMTRLTNAFSKKVENHAHQHAINFAFYNFCRIHRSLRVTPARESVRVRATISVTAGAGRAMATRGAQPRCPSALARTWSPIPASRVDAGGPGHRTARCPRGRAGLS